jgi:hypothetical protein
MGVRGETEKCDPKIRIANNNRSKPTSDQVVWNSTQKL